MNRNSTEQNGAVPGAHSVTDDWFTSGRFALLLAGFIILMFPGVVFGTRAFFFRDYGIFSYPTMCFQRECFWNGEWPLWNPYNCCGIPFAAQWGTMVFYPFTLLHLLLPLPWALGLMDLIHLFWGGLGMYFLAARWSGNRFGAAMAGMAFAFNGMILNNLLWPHYMVVFAWMPFVVLCAEDAWQQGGRKILMAALAGTMQMLGGVPEIILLTWLIIGGLFLIHQPRWTGIGRLGLTGLLISGLSAVQLLPFFELLAHSNRSPDFADSTWSLPLAGWLNLLVPMFHCYETPLGVFFPPNQGVTSSYYLGIVALALALLAVLRWSDRRVRYLFVLALAGLLLALGDKGFLYAALRRVFPWIGFMRYPVKFFFLTSFAVPLLAGLALVAVYARPPAEDRGYRRGLWLVVGALLAGIAGTVLFARLFPDPHEQWTAVWQSGLSRGLLLVMAAFGLWQLRPAAGLSRSKAVALQAGLVLLVGVDAWTHAPNQNPTASTGVCRLGLVTEKLALEPMLGRCRGWRDRDTERLFYFRMLADPDADNVGRRFGLYGDCNLLDRIPTPDGFYSLYPARQNEIAQALCQAPTNRFPDGLANFLGIAYVTNPTNLLVWRTRTNALPLFTAGQEPVFLDPKTTLARIQAPDFDAQRLVYLPPEVRASVSVTNRTAARILSQHVTAHRITAEIEAKEPSLMVIAQTWYPCWRAYVDGTPVPLWQANYAFQALEVPSGKHEVKLVYQDRAFVLGGWISLLTLAVMGAAWFRWRPGSPETADGWPVSTKP